MLTKESENFPFRQIKQASYESKKNSSRIHSNDHGPYTPFGASEQDYISETKVHPEHKKMLIWIGLAACFGALLVIALMVLIYVFE